MASAMFKFGAKDASKDEEYELLLEDQIEFIQALTLEGTKKDKKSEISETERKKMDIEETKKSLPVYPFRDDLIAAIREHQVSVFDVVCSDSICSLNLFDVFRFLSSKERLEVARLRKYRSIYTRQALQLVERKSDAHNRDVWQQCQWQLVLPRKWESNWETKSVIAFDSKTVRRNER